MKRWIYTTLAAIIITPIIAGAWTSVKTLYAMSKDQEKYEDAYVKVQEFTSEQRMANMEQQVMNKTMQEDQSRQWKSIELMMERMLDGK